MNSKDLLEKNSQGKAQSIFKTPGRMPTMSRKKSRRASKRPSAENPAESEKQHNLCTCVRKWSIFSSFSFLPSLSENEVVDPPLESILLSSTCRKPRAQPQRWKAEEG
jgi:hypothetical protein